jgi:hypothetical protein
MGANIKCPSCGHAIDVEGAIAGELEQQLQKEYESKFQQSLKNIELDRTSLKEEQRVFEEKKKKENELFAQKVIQEKQKMEAEIAEKLRKSISSDFENQLRFLEENNKDNEEKLKLSRQKELEFMQKELALKNKEAEMEIAIQRQLQEERAKLSEELRKLEEQRVANKENEYQLKLREMEKQLDDQKMLAEEMRRKAEQGSMQLQGEAQELLLEEMLKESFPYDSIEEVKKGLEGADCIQVVRNLTGRDYGRIIYECKRTKNWSNNWISKLKSDLRNSGADSAILVTQAFPKDMNQFGEIDGVWVCNYSEVTPLAAIIRDSIIRISDAKRSEENKGEKMQLLYNYLTGSEFRHQVEAIVEGFMAMRNSITKERLQMEKIWKEREKQLEKVLLSTSGMYGSVKGIAGSSVENIPLLEGESEEEVDDMAH